MLQEVKNLQQRAVADLLRKTAASKRELTFRAPTGSGKTRMMADFMNRVLASNKDVVFLVSTLSKGGLAEQNYDVFKDCADKGVFPEIDPWLISTEISGEETLFIPTDHSVYVLPRDLYKKNGRLMQGAMLNFLQTLTESYFGYGMGKKIWLIKDECHQATNNLDDLSEKHFQKVINFSATPNLRRGQVPDVQITDEEAKPIADKIINGSRDTKVNTDWFINDIKYYLAAKKMMDVYILFRKLGIVNMVELL